MISTFHKDYLEKLTVTSLPIKSTLLIVMLLIQPTIKLSKVDLSKNLVK